MTVIVGTELAGYRIEDEIARGGMGVVYRATEIALDRPVALKLIAPELANDPAFRERFLHESQLAASLDHLSILPVYAAGEAGDELFLATRFVEGTDLGTLLAQKRTLTPERALALLGQIANALDAAHARGLLHRDVKPGNILVDASDHCYLSDFGLSRQLADGEAASDALAGSLHYLAPEQIRGESLDGRADAYALACVLYECLSGAPPFRRETQARTLWAHLQEEAAPIAAHAELDPVFARALAKSPRHRFRSCAAFVRSARSAVEHAEHATARRHRLRRALGIVAAIAVFVAVEGAGIVAVSVLGSHDPENVIVPRPNTVAAIAPYGVVLTSIPVGEAPTALAASGGSVWVFNSREGAGTISRIDAHARLVVTTFSVPSTPVDLLAIGESLWVVTIDDRVLRVDLDGDVVRSWTLPTPSRTEPRDERPATGRLAYGAGLVWVAGPRSLASIDPRTSELTLRVRWSSGPIAFGLGSIWTTTPALGLVRFDPGNSEPEPIVGLSFDPIAIAANKRGVWLLDDDGSRVWLIDPTQRIVHDVYTLTGEVSAIATVNDDVWAASDDGALSAPDFERIPIDGTATDVAVDAGLVWVAVS